MNRRWIAIALAIVLIAVVARIARERMGDRAERRESRELRTMLLKAGVPATGPFGDDSTTLLTKRFYKTHGFKPIWTDGLGLQSRAKDLLEAFDASAAEGLEPDDYANQRLVQLVERERDRLPAATGDPARLAEIDVRMTAGFLRYASDLFDGRVDPHRLPTDWLTHPRRTSLIQQLENALAHGVDPTLAALTPPHAGYARLRSALANYRQIAQHGGWPQVPGGPPLAVGAHGARVATLRARLATSGDLDPHLAGGDRFDASLANAVRTFQARHGLEPTGRVAAGDLAELNVPVASRIHRIALNMERWRWLPDTLGARAVIVNIPEFMLRVVESGHPALEMRVVVGKDVSSTPVFSDEISHIVFGPTWSIPPDIVAHEIVPALREDRGYLATHHIRVLDGAGPDAGEVDAGRLDLGDSAAVAAYSFRQDPGEDNALGHVKFMCPNRFNVYLHDTPATALFDRRERNFSHGCVRVEQPAELATYLLRDTGKWPRERVVAEMDTARSETVSLKKPVPVHILYWTAWVDDAGAVQFRPDLYDLDPLTDSALLRHERAVTRATAKLATFPTPSFGRGARAEHGGGRVAVDRPSPAGAALRAAAGGGTMR